MKIAIMGTNPNAHFMCQKLQEEDGVTHVYQFGANEGVQPNSKFIPLTITPTEQLDFLKNNPVDLIVMTTTEHLLWKQLRELIDQLKIPCASAGYSHSHLEWSKIEGKKLLNWLNIPTAKSRIFKAAKLKEIFDKIPRPFILKFERDWRCGLQTLLITDENYVEEGQRLFTSGAVRYLQGVYGDFTDQHFIVEEVIKGVREYSYHAILGHKNWRYIGSARDYKKFHEGDIGFNTAGMGAYSPVKINPVVHEYADKIFSYYREKNNPYIGILYLGIMEDANGKPYVLEINARPGDPEFQTIYASYGKDFSLSKTLMAAASGDEIPELPEPSQHSVSIRIVNSDYRKLIDNKSDEPPKEINPDLWPVLPGIFVSYNRERHLLNSIVTTSGDTVESASDSLYKFLENKSMFNFTYRKDIGKLK